MIVFNTLTLQNFMSIGDNPISISLDRSITTLITGGNGCGKSSLGPEGLTYALFGKSFRGLNKPQLVNTVNQKNCLATIEFTKNSDSYKVIRGMKPGIFEIYKNDSPIDESSSVRDFQSVLEDILGFTYNEFIKTIVLGNANYKPFLQLSAGERRTYVESLLGLSIFTDMNKNLKLRFTALKDSIERKSYDKKLKSEIITEKMIFMNHLIESEEFQKQTQNAKIEKYKQELDNNQLLIDAHMLQLIDIDPIKTELDLIDSTIAEYSKQIIGCEQEQRREYKALEFFKDKATAKCNVCFQKITEKFKTDTIVITERILDQLKQKKIELIAINDSMYDNRNKLEKIIDFQFDLETTINQLKKANLDIESRMQDVLVDVDFQVAIRLKSTTAEIEKLKIELQDVTNELDLQLEDKRILDVAAELLKDTGIKSSIIKRYIPMINSYINHYLDVLDFGVQCILDDQFNDTMKGRFANEFTYLNLSQGERTRIDLAILFALRQVSAVCSGVDVNVLILDEVCDSSLDASGVDALFTIIEEACQNQNVFIISHRPDVSEKCRSSIVLEKCNGYTRIV